MNSSVLHLIDVIACVSSCIVIAGTGILWYNFLRQHSDDKEDKDG